MSVYSAEIRKLEIHSTDFSVEASKIRVFLKMKP